MLKGLGYLKDFIKFSELPLFNVAGIVAYLKHVHRIIKPLKHGFFWKRDGQTGQLPWTPQLKGWGTTSKGGGAVGEGEGSTAEGGGATAEGGRVAAKGLPTLIKF